MLRRQRTVSTAVVMLLSGAAFGQVDPLSGIDFVRIGAVGNAPWVGGGTGSDSANGRGRVDYEYKIGRFEVTSAQWVEFLNAALDRPSNDLIPHVHALSYWGGVATTPQNGGRRYAVPAGNEMLPAGDISWRMAAIYCNWLHNGKGLDRAAFMNGVYDVSTFHYTPEGDQADQLTHNPDARYWIPTWDEWVKAAHYDPSKASADGSLGGYWRYGNGSDEPFVYGPLGARVRYIPRPFPDPNGQLATANAWWDRLDFPASPFSIPLGAYGVQSPWGLYDVAGATSELLETSLHIASTHRTYRYYEGSSWEGPTALMDEVRWAGGAETTEVWDYHLGLRLASAVPSPGVCSLMLLGAAWTHWPRRRPQKGQRCELRDERASWSGLRA